MWNFIKLSCGTNENYFLNQVHFQIRYFSSEHPVEKERIILLSDFSFLLSHFNFTCYSYFLNKPFLFRIDQKEKKSYFTCLAMWILFFTNNHKILSLVQQSKTPTIHSWTLFSKMSVWLSSPEWHIPAHSPLTCVAIGSLHTEARWWWVSKQDGVKQGV